MMEDSPKLREEETLNRAADEHPELFRKSTVIEDADFLRTFGIWVHRKEMLPKSYIRLFPQDFIVEEVMKGGEIISANRNEEDPHLIQAEEPTVYATLLKARYSTIQAVEDIARQLGIQRERVQYAGIKDKDAITAQRLSFREIRLDRLMTIQAPQYILQDFSLGKGAIEMSGLDGNRFTILVRHCGEPFNKQLIKERIDEINEIGFPNYYYIQRFGTPRLISQQLGLLLLKGEYQKAVELSLFHTSPQELPYISSLRQSLQTLDGDWKRMREIVETLPFILQSERKLLIQLEKNPQDFVGALLTIPDQVRLWAYAFSSLLFNHLLSSYIVNDDLPPNLLPLILTTDTNAHQLYKPLLEELHLYPLDFTYLRPFKHIRLAERGVESMAKTHISQHYMVPEGIILEFTLAKGVYATTLLANLFTLVSGAPPETVPREKRNIKADLGDDTFKKTLEYFSPILDLNYKERKEFEE